MAGTVSFTFGPDPLFISRTVYCGSKPMAQASTTEPPDTLHAFDFSVHFLVN